MERTQKIGTIDLYRNRSYRVRIKHQRENLHIGYYPNEESAHNVMLKLMHDQNFLMGKHAQLIRKRTNASLKQRAAKRRRLEDGNFSECDEDHFACGKKRWDQKAIDLLVELREKNYPWHLIASRLKRTVEACKSRVWRTLRHSNSNKFDS